MNPKSIDLLFWEAARLGCDTDRADYLDRECSGRPAVREKVEQLLAVRAEAAAFLERPPLAAPASVAGDTLSRATEEGTQSAEHEPRPAEVGMVVAGRYKLLEEVGVGGMGSVWMAEQTDPVSRRVAVKLIKSGMDSKQVVARFEAERQALALMDHPHIAKVLDGGATADGRPFFVMELVKGTPITRYCDEKRLTIRDRLGLFADVCRAVQHAHQKGIIHRDLKPSNVLVAPYDGRPVVKVIDFGVAKATGQKLTDATLFTGFGAVVGTPAYMSPEQAELNNADIDTRSDVYSLGVLLYELLTGSTPLTRQRVKEAAILEVLRLVREEEPPRPSTRLSTADELPTIAAVRGEAPTHLSKLVRGELDWIVMKALEKDRNRRYETANGLAADVQRYLSDEAVQACPPSAGYRLKKFARRNKAALATAGVFAVALLLTVITLAVSTALIWNAKEQTRAEWERAEREKDRADTDRRLTRKALDDMTSGVIEDILARQPNLTTDQQEFLETALGHYKQFAAQTGESEEARGAKALAHDRVGTICNRLGRAEQAEAAYRDAIRLWGALVANFPTEPAYRRHLATSQHHLANHLRPTSRKTEAEQLLSEALVTMRQLVAEPASDHEDQNALAGTLVDLSKHFRERNDFQQARELLAEAIPYHQAAMKARPRNPVYLKYYRNNLSNLAAILDTLGDRPAALKALAEVLALSKQLAARYPEEREYRSSIAHTLGEMASILTQSGEWPKAKVVYEESIAILERLVADFPAEVLHRQNLAATEQNLGVMFFNLQQAKEARLHLERSLGIWKVLAHQYPNVLDYRCNLGTARNHFAAVLSETQRFDEAETEFRAALREYEAVQKGGTPEYLFRKADAHNSLGVFLRNRGRTDDAEKEYRQCVGIVEKLTSENPSVPLYAVVLGRSYSDVGELHVASGRRDSALEWFNKAITTVQPVLTKAPRDNLARMVQSTALTRRARLLGMMNRHRDAIGDWDRAVDLDDSKFSPLRVERMIALVHGGEPKRAIAEADFVADRKQAIGEEVYNAACVYALASGFSAADSKLAEQYADRAVALLRRAIEKGYRDIETMKQDSDLDSLRQRPDFKKLIADLEKKQPPKSPTD